MTRGQSIITHALTLYNAVYIHTTYVIRRADPGIVEIKRRVKKRGGIQGYTAKCATDFNFGLKINDYNHMFVKNIITTLICKLKHMIIIPRWFHMIIICC